MSKKGEMICSSNIQLRKLVNAYAMHFIENKKENKTQKKQKEKKFTILTIILQATT